MATYTWKGGIGSPTDPAQWTLTSGTGNANGYPGSGDSAAVNAGTVIGGSTSLSGESLTVFNATYQFGSLTDSNVTVGGSLISSGPHLPNTYTVTLGNTVASSAIEINAGFLSTGGDAMSIGQNLAGTMFVDNSGTVVDGAQTPSIPFATVIGNHSGGNGSLYVRGAGSTFTSGGDMLIGREIGANGTLDVETGGLVTVQGAMSLGLSGGSGEVFLHGGTISATSVSIANFGFVEGNGTIKSNIAVTSGFISAQFSKLLEVTGGVSGSGGIAAESGGTLRIDGIFTNTGTISFDSFNETSTVILADLQVGGSLANPIKASLFGTTAVAQVELGGVTFDSAFSVATEIMLFLGGKTVFTFTNVSGGPASPMFLKTGLDTATGFDYFQIACFCEGTLIGTVNGEVTVETLKTGDPITTVLCEATASVRAIRRRRVDCARHARPERVWPVRIPAHSFGADLPMRDLLVSPDHALYLNGWLVPAKHLLGAGDIARAPMDSVTYYHVELDRHDVLLAEGLPTESYLDTGAPDGTVSLHPDHAARRWEAEGCAPLLVSGPALEAIRARVARPRQRAA